MPNSSTPLQVLVISGNSKMRRSMELILRRAGMAIIGSDSLLAYLAHWKEEAHLLDAVVLEAGEADPATVGRIQILASLPQLPKTLLVAGAETLEYLDLLKKRPEIKVLVEPFSAELLLDAVHEIASSEFPTLSGVEC